ncbi:MAG: hypothetical protein V4478_02220 [Patescibacteria group bacterium]
MSARLFRSIRSTIVSFNKTLFLTAGVFLAVLFLHVPIVHAELTPEQKVLEKNRLDSKYAESFNNFQAGSGLTSGTVLKAGSDNASSGLVFKVKLNVDPSKDLKGSDTIKNPAWRAVSSTPRGGQLPLHSMFILLCEKNNAARCWISEVPVKVELVPAEKNTIFVNSEQGNTIPTQEVAIETFKTDDNQYNLYSYDSIKQEFIGSIASLKLLNGTTLTASLWYQGVFGASEEYTKAGIVTDNPLRVNFGGGQTRTSYFRIGAPIEIKTPADAAQQAQQAADSAAALANDPVRAGAGDDNLPVCIFAHPISGEGSIMGCVAQVAYGLYSLTAWVAGIFGNLFDFFIGYSVSDTSYRYTFAVTGWKLVRDISNIFFIIIMVWTGFTAVLQASTATMRKVVPSLIVNAFLINFSLFATRVVIDISNITARMFYSQMIVCDKVNIDANGKCPAAQAKRGAGGYWPLSEKIVSSFNPQIIFNSNILKLPNYDDSSSGSSALNGGLKGGRVQTTSDSDYATYFMVVCIIAAIIMGGITLMFFKVAFLFLGRVVGLYVCMIFAPFAFLSRGIPFFDSMKKLKFKDWWGELVNYSLLAPIFTFFLYIIYGFLSSNFVAEIGFVDTKGDFFGTILSVVIPMLIIFSLLEIAQKTAEKYAGEMGEKVQKLGTQATGLAIGAASGGAALLGGRVIGGLAKRVDESRVGIGIRNMAAKSGVAGWAGRNLQKGVNATRSGSFDLRQTGAGKKVLGKLGIDADQKALNTFAGVGLGLGTDQRKGGYESDVKRRQERLVANEKLLEEKAGEEIKAYNEKAKVKYDKKVNEALEAGMLLSHSAADIAAAKSNADQTLYNSYRDEASRNATVQANINAVTKPVPVASADELTSTRRKTYTEGLKKGGVITRLQEAAIRQGEKGGVLNSALGASAELLGATVGAALGSQVRTEGSRKAGKKLEEKSKIDKELQTIEETLEKGFKNLISLETYGKEFDKLSDPEKASVGARQSAINSDKEIKKQWEQRVQAVEESKYNTKDLKSRASALRKTMIATGSQADVNAYFDAIAQVEAATKHEKIWRDVSKFREDQKKKLKGEESK